MTLRRTRCNSDVANCISSLTARSACCVAGELFVSMPSKMRLFIIIPGQYFNWSTGVGHIQPMYDLAKLASYYIYVVYMFLGSETSLSESSSVRGIFAWASGRWLVLALWPCCFEKMGQMTL